MNSSRSLINRSLISFLAVCASLALCPWALCAIVNPLPESIRQTETVFASTHISRVDGNSSLQEGTPTRNISVQPLSTQTITPSSTPSPTATLTPAPTYTASPTQLPTPEVMGVTLRSVDVYTCPLEQKKGVLEEGTLFVILGWNETQESDHTVGWFLIDDQIGSPQQWIIANQDIIFSATEYKVYTPRVACR